MNSGSELPKRRSIRLEGYDYSQEGAYFVTVCAYNHELLFENKLYKEIVETGWLNTANLRPNIELDEFVVMPNHVHGIIFIKQQAEKKAQNSVGAYCRTPLEAGKKANVNSPHGDQRRANINSPLQSDSEYRFKGTSQTIGSIIRGFKSSTTKKINMLRGTPGESVWQRNYYEHIIRNDDDLYRTREYVRENPQKWALDEENPGNFPGARGATKNTGGKHCTRISRNRSMS